MAKNEVESTMPDWKRLWQLISGIYYAPAEEDLKSTLLDITKELQDGILQFKKCSTANNSSNDLEKLLKMKKQDKLLPFTSKLQQLLDLQSEQCWEILCFYLTNEYRGTASSLTTLISTESNMIKLLDDIWGFYTLERIIVLKIVKNMLEFYKNDTHPYHKEYKFILDNITLVNLKTSYLKQFNVLINELPPNKLIAGEFLNYHTKLIDWNERNCREIIEILQILLLLVNFCGVNLDEMKLLMDGFKQHSFGRQQRYLNESNETHSELIARITYSEVILFMKCLDLTDSEIDSTWITNVIKTFNKQIVTMYLLPEHGPILLIWMLINFYNTQDPTDDDENCRRFRQFGGKAVQLNVFIYLNQIISHSMFKDNSLVARITRKTVYNHLSNLCQLFNDDGSVGRHDGVYELLNELLSTPSIANYFCQDEDAGIRSLYTTVLENFPIDFINLANISCALTTSGKSLFVKEQLENLPIYSELYDERNFKLESVGDDEFLLVGQYEPFRGIDYAIPAGTSAIVVEHSQGHFVHFRTKNNFYNTLHNEINLLLSRAIQYTDFDEKHLKRVTVGIKYLALVINKMKVPGEISSEMVHPTELCIDLLNKFKFLQVPPIELLANCLNICTALVPHFREEISNRVINLNVLPFIGNPTLDYKKYANGVTFDPSLVGTYLINLERNNEKYDFLIAYINFLRKYTIANAGEENGSQKLSKVEIPGLIFLLREVFPYIHSWRFSSSSERNKIYRETMEYICDVFDIVTNESTAERQLLKNICVYSLLNLDNGIVLLRFIAIGNPYLQSSMEVESNWLSAPADGIIRLVRLSMRILMHLLRLKTTIYERSKLSPLESLIYTQPKQRDTLRIIPVLTCYMNNIFDRFLPILSCRLLRRIALEFKMSLLACLDMEPDQIRMIFLERLPDELESDDLKVAILEFVEACIEKQPGLTEAFFKINYEKEKRLFAPKEQPSQITDSIITYMEIYLSTALETPDCIEDRAPQCIMSLFHALWKNNMQMLVNDLVEKNKLFWSSLCSPLFSEKLKLNCKAYSQILNILGIQLFTSNPQLELNENLQKCLEKFFEKGNFDKWLDHVFDLPKVEIGASEDFPEWLCRLQSFKDFLIIILNKKISKFEVPQDELRILAYKCLNILVSRSEYTNDLRPFLILSELYLIVLFNFKHNYTTDDEQDKDMLAQITNLLSNLALCYEDLHSRAKEACLSISIKVSGLLATELKKDPTIALSYLDPIVTIICWELNALEYNVKIEIVEKTINENLKTKSLELSLNLLKTIANIFHNDDEVPKNWYAPFCSNRIFNRLLSCINLILPIVTKQTLSMEILDVLIVFAKGNCSRQLLFCDISEYLWLKLLPPKELLQALPVIPHTIQINKDLIWSPQKWWPIYSRGIELVGILFQKHHYHFLSDTLKFVGIHEEYLMDSLLLAKQTLEPNAIVLIKNTIYFIQTLVEFEKEWRLEHSQSLFNIMRCVQVLLGHAISLFNQHRNLKRLLSGSTTQFDPIRNLTQDCFPEDIITAMNDLTEIIIVATRCLLKFSPDLLLLICEPEFLICKWEPLFEIQFGPPKLNDSNQLTFGTILSIIGILTKALNLQGHGFHEIPLNHFPKGTSPTTTVDINIRSPVISQAAITRTTNFSKSISVNSSSTTAPSNEILSNLNGDLCQMALENILTLVASQSLLALKNYNLTQREKQLIRREISTELIAFHEFIRKKVLIDLREHRDLWHRKKRSIEMMTDETDGKMSTIQSSSLKRRSDNKNSMRVNVVRRLHLQTQQQKAVDPDFEMSQIISPINKQNRSSRAGDPTSSTPATRKSEDNNEPNKIMITEEDDNIIQYFEPEEPKYSPLSYIQFVEEDYLHLLSNLFTIICQSD